MKLLFASANLHKVEEVARILGPGYELLSLQSVGYLREIPEEGTTFEANALAKALALASHFSIPCFADDSGLEVDVLGGAPGVWSARFSGERNPLLRDAANIALLLQKLEGVSQRSARFRTVIAFVNGGQNWFFEGKVEGTIALAPRGTGGFGYDPVFVPEGFASHFSELSMEEKNRISHRGQAVRRLAAFLSASANIPR